jgi:hypothetical protein
MLALINALLMVTSCVPGGAKKETADCGVGQVFNTRTRSCSSAGVTVSSNTPTGTFSSLSVTEDSAAYISLSYADNDSDKALSCRASSASDGLVRRTIFDGLILDSQPSIIDSQNTQIVVNNTGALSISTATIGSVRLITLNIDAATTSSVAAAAALNGDATAATWVSAAVTANQLIGSAGSSYSLTDLNCFCTAGSCRVYIRPADDYNGVTDFSYDLTDGDGTGSATLASVTVTSVNDTPNLTVNTNFAVTERYDSDTTTTLNGSISGAGYVTADDIKDGDALGTTLSYEVVTAPTEGVLSLDSFGNFSYYTYSEATGDSFTFRVRDPDGSYSTTQTMLIVITNVNDPPLGTLSSLASFNEDSDANGGAPITLTYADQEGDLATSCSVTSASNVYPTSTCVCAAGICQVSMKAIGNVNGSASFGYKIFDAFAGAPVEQTVSFTITAIDDAPVMGITETATGILQFSESATQIPNDYSFTLDGATELDGGSIASYTITTAPVNGTLTGCLGSQGASTSSLACTYTPADGNVSDSATLSETLPSTDLSRIATDAGTFYVKNFGDTYDGLTINMVAVANLSALFGVDVKAWYDSGAITMLFEAGVADGSDIIAAIAGDTTLSKIIQFDDTGGTQTTAGALVFAGGAATADKFTVQVTDNSGTTSTQTLHISMIPSLDPPTICEYSSYADTAVCGINGCIGSVSPIAITPDADGLTYYNSSAGVCYVSASGSWTAQNSYINSRTVNELDTIVIDKIKIDEGGGSTEDTETVTITNVDSSDVTLIPIGNIRFFFDSTDDGFTSGDEVAVGAPFAGASSADARGFKIEVTPQTISSPDDTRTSDIEVTIADSSGNITEVEFTVTVQKVSVTHGGWAAFKSIGPKVNALGIVEDAKDHCPYSLDMCENGNQCYGTSIPTSNSSADPDHVDAIYIMDTAVGSSCYRMKRTQVQNISYVGKTAVVPTITYVDTGAVSVSVTSGAITVNIDDGVTTTDQIITAIEADATAHALVKAINLKAAETQNTQATTTLAALSNTSWEVFTAFCAVTPAGFETGCAQGSRDDRLSCLGTSSPVGVITPTRKDSRYWDEEANLCYRSTGTANTDWETYDKTAAITVTWNQFSVSGSGSISEYRVFRRLANEEFDFSQQMNREAITGSSSTFSFLDDAINSRFPPVPGTVYYYVVRPVINGVLGSTSAEKGTGQFGTVRLMAPPKNMTFAHRWMINKQFCDLMGKTTDTSQNHRCSYKGPGDITDGGNFYYDFGKDMLVDRFEAGCPFSPAPNCLGTADNSCIGTDEPGAAGANLSASAIGNVYYDRSTAKCYYANSADNLGWVEFDTAELTTHFSTNDQVTTMRNKTYNRSGLPPFTHVTQEQANTACTNLNDVPASELLGIQVDLSHVLPSRKEQLSYSLWDDTLNDSSINTLEIGQALNQTSACNSLTAAGLSAGYNDLDKPDSSNYYSLPGTSTSAIRSLATGSSQTESCVSAFGVQDMVGNVAEWTRDRMTCATLSTCSAPTTIAGAAQTDYQSSDGTDPYGAWQIDGTRFPCLDAFNSDGVCDISISSQTIESEYNSAGLFHTPMGLPFDVDAPSTYVTDIDVLTLGNDINHAKLHDDVINFNQDYIYAEASTCGAFVGGGHYDGSSTGAGVWNLEAYPCSATSYGAVTFGDITLKIDQDPTYVTKQVHLSTFAGGGAIGTAVTEVGNVIQIDLDVFTANVVAATATNIVTQLNAYFAGLANEMVAVVSGEATQVQAGFVTAIDVVDFQAEATPKRSSIGFRCSMDVDTADYEE